MNSFQHPERMPADSLSFLSGRDFIGTLKSSDIIHQELHRGVTLAMSNTLEVTEFFSFFNKVLRIFECQLRGYI